MSTQEIQQLQKDIKSLTKLVRKVYNHLQDPTGEKAAERAKNSALLRPKRVSEELRAFLDLGADEMISRPEVTKRISAYIKKEELQHPDNKKVIVPDDKLKKLLKPTGDLTYPSMQSLLSPHYLPDEGATEKNAESKPKVKKAVSPKK
jgi:chromatin remodeling complex protein RSC6